MPENSGVIMKPTIKMTTTQNSENSDNTDANLTDSSIRWVV